MQEHCTAAAIVVFGKEKGLPIQTLGRFVCHPKDENKLLKYFSKLSLGFDPG
jgi:hypothetical protein